MKKIAKLIIKREIVRYIIMRTNSPNGSKIATCIGSHTLCHIKPIFARLKSFSKITKHQRIFT